MSRQHLAWVEAPPPATRLQSADLGNERLEGRKKAYPLARPSNEHIAPPTLHHETNRMERDVSSQAYDFPRTNSPVSDDSSYESMTPNLAPEDTLSSAVSPTGHVSHGATTELKELSLNDRKPPKRPAPIESSHWAGVQPPPKLGRGPKAQHRSAVGRSRPPDVLQQQCSPDERGASEGTLVFESDVDRVKREAVHQDSAYYSRSNTLDAKMPEPLANPSAVPPELVSGPNMGPSKAKAQRTAALHPLKPGGRAGDRKPNRAAESHQPQWQPAMQRSSKHGYSGMILQPESSPISEEQLAAEIKGIYDGVSTVEIKCIDIDAALARDSKSQLGVEQWQALIALHRTLLYEHHDFLMATQHPSASENLRSLATKYSMPARMWKHGIHAFLEVLRHRRPDSQDYMLAFVVLAYQMMALLFETVPCFTDTWIECLGDLARYRMAIEDDREMHAVWGGVAARWYTLASDRHPEIGRLYHHLGILERPSMRKMASYAKSLTCSIPFVNARDSMNTFCTPIVQEEQLSKSNVGSAEAILVTFLALVFLGSDLSLVQSTATSGLRLLSDQPTVKTKDFGPQLVLATVASLFGFGAAHNNLTQSFSTTISDEHRSARPSEAALPGSTSSNTPSIAATSASSQVIEFSFACFNALIRPQNSTQSNSDVLASVHVILAWFHSLHSLGLRSHDQSTQHTISALMDPDRFSWGGLCLYLNGLCQDKPIDDNVFESARQGSLPGSHEPGQFVPLAEDYWMRGLLWAQMYLPKDLLPARADEIESLMSGAARTQRVQWLALSLAFRSGYVKYDVLKKEFRAPVPGPLPKTQVSRIDSMASSAGRTDFVPSTRTTTWATQSSAPTSPTTSRSSTTISMGEDSDGYTMVPRQKVKPGRSWAKVAAAPPKKASPERRDVRVVGADEYVQ